MTAGTLAPIGSNDPVVLSDGIGHLSSSPFPAFADTSNLTTGLFPVNADVMAIGSPHLQKK
jgi:hypothetical protein